MFVRTRRHAFTHLASQYIHEVRLSLLLPSLSASSPHTRLTPLVLRSFLFYSCLARLSTRQRVSVLRRCGELPKVGNSSLANYRKLSYWLPSALALAGGTTSGATAAAAAAAAGRDVRERRAAMFRSRSLRQRLSEACEAVMDSEAVKGSTSSRRERGLRRLFASSGSGASAGGQGHGLFSSTRNSVILIVGIFAAMVAYQRYGKV